VQAQHLAAPDAFARTFDGKIQQVFVYATNKCQLQCRQCLYKPLLRSGAPDFSFEDLDWLLRLFHSYGAYKLSFLGGEPTLYFDRASGSRVGDLVELGFKTGFNYVRMDTNGQFASALLQSPQMASLSEITFSLDGFTPDTNDEIRGEGTLRKCLASIEQAVALGYRVQITTCVHNVLCPDPDTGFDNMVSMIRFAEGLGVRAINFHPILMAGIPRDGWIDGTDIPAASWMQIYRRLRQEISSASFSVAVRLPARFVGLNEYLANSDSYDYCPVRMGERVLILPDGSLKICAFEIGTPNSVAHFSNGTITMAQQNNEIAKIAAFDPSCGPCMNQRPSEPSLVPLCMSFKPHQRELVWSTMRADAAEAIPD
jgi:molybdenum cofactor biosynthesis enzyme MoaA